MTKLMEMLRRLPLWVEVLVVLGLCFGPPTAQSIAAVGSGEAFRLVEFNNAFALSAILEEGVIFGLCATFLYLRGFKLWREVRAKLTLRAWLVSLVLFVGTYASYALIFNVVYIVAGSENLPIAKYTVSIYLPFVVVLSLVNPIFEELFVVGYLFERLPQFGPVILISLSVSIRVAYHLYQGWVGILSMLPLGIIFAFTYWKTKNLWPLVVSHALMDFVGLVTASE